jgi:Ca2+-binding EF-hand superfamily protein
MDKDLEDNDANSFELSQVEKNVCKENFQFYDKERKGFVERFELPMILTGKYFIG